MLRRGGYTQEASIRQWIPSPGPVVMYHSLCEQVLVRYDQRTSVNMISPPGPCSSDPYEIKLVPVGSLIPVLKIQ